ncbi:D-alanine--D-alanine ligase [Thalassotalea sp. PP2-459]|uniref:D-alanine--D-alanine ligase n=1 Tax=Thalassotalea sp. PP2-459 TaxID=1742724 RepID=UPI000A9DE36E|nr:D-alanine--D-alanine ligase [Thalassotalea sp. PP2-459]
MKANLHIAVLFGGDSAEREVSLRSGQAVANGLTEAGFKVTLIDTKDYCLSDLARADVDHVFIALHGRGGEDGSVQGALEYMNISYTGSGVLGSALAMDKIRSKQVMQSAAIPTAAFEIVHKDSFNNAQAKTILQKLGDKVMVKPAHEGSSIGMSVAENPSELTHSLETAFQYDEEVLVEAWISGPEYTVAILGNNALPAIHMETPNTFYDYQAKYQSSTTRYHCPSGLSDNDEKALSDIALKAFKCTGAKDWGRVDVMRDNKNQWQVLEVNTVPGMTETSLVPKAAKVYGLSFVELVTKIVELSIDNKGK